MPRRMSRMARMEIMRPDRTREPESRFRDRTGREHYEDGRFAPMRNDTNIEIEGRFRDDRGGERLENRRGSEMNYGAESRRYRRDDMGRFRADYDYETYGAQGRSNGGRMNREDWERRDGGRMNYPGSPFPVYQERDGMRGGGYDMNRIGFNANREWDGDRVGMNMEYPMRNEMAYMPGQREAGHAMGAGMMMQPMTKEEAERWVQSMRSSIGTRGQHWTMEQAKQIMTRHGYQHDPTEFYVALNMMKSDYSKAAQKVGADKEEFYAAMADAFLNDEDANEDKLALYHHYIAKKG